MNALLPLEALYTAIPELHEIDSANAAVEQNAMRREVTQHEPDRLIAAISSVGILPHW